MTDNYQQNRLLTTHCNGVYRLARPPEHIISSVDLLLLDTWWDSTYSVRGSAVGTRQVGGQAVGQRVLDCVSTLVSGSWAWASIVCFVTPKDVSGWSRVRLRPLQPSTREYYRPIGALAGCPSDFIRFLRGEWHVFWPRDTVEMYLNYHASQAGPCRDSLLQALRSDAWLPGHP